MRLWILACVGLLGACASTPDVQPRYLDCKDLACYGVHLPTQEEYEAKRKADLDEFYRRFNERNEKYPYKGHAYLWDPEGRIEIGLDKDDPDYGNPRWYELERFRLDPGRGN